MELSKKEKILNILNSRLSNFPMEKIIDDICSSVYNNVSTSKIARKILNFCSDILFADSEFYKSNEYIYVSENAMNIAEEIKNV